MLLSGRPSSKRQCFSAIFASRLPAASAALAFTYPPKRRTGSSPRKQSCIMFLPTRNPGLVASIGGLAMKLRSLSARRIDVLVFSLCVFGLLASPSMPEEVKFSEDPVVEKKVTELPSGRLYWRLENFPTLAQAQDAAGPTSLAAEVAGKVWLFTLGAKDGATPGGTKVAEIGPLPIGPPFPPLEANEYLLRVNRAGGPPGAKTPIHTHPGPEAFYVLSGKLGMTANTGAFYAEAGTTMIGSWIGVDAPMEVFNAGTLDLEALAIFVVD